MNVVRTPAATDQEIILLLQTQHDIQKRKAEEQFFTTYAYFVKEGMKKYKISEEESLDAYSDSVLSAIEQISNGTFNGESSIKTYLYRIFHNKCVDLLRKKTTNKNSVHHTLSIPDMLMQLSDTARSVVQKLIDEADRELLTRKLNQLGDSCRKLLWFSAEGYTDREISVMMEYKTADVVKTSRLRCLEKLRTLYKP